jgi:hypothetical protein
MSMPLNSTARKALILFLNISFTLLTIGTQPVKIEFMRPDGEPRLPFDLAYDIIEAVHFIQFDDGRTARTDEVMMMVVMMGFCLFVVVMAIVKRIMLQPVSALDLANEADLFEDGKGSVDRNEANLGMSG